MDKERVNLEMDIHTKENSSTVFFMERVSLTGLIKLSTRVNSTATRSLVLENISGLMVLLMKVKSKMGLDMDKENTLTSKKVLNTKENGLMV